jgi:hypothetical protein
VRFVIDPDNLISEVSESNNQIEDRVNAIIAGFWVEQSMYDYFHQHQIELGIGSNSWPDWIQRQMRRQNELYASAIWPISPQGVLDRVRIDKIVVVPDGALPLHGGIATNTPDLWDRTVDLMWGFQSIQLPPNSNFYADHTTAFENNPFYIEQSLIHELGHARYLIDSYGFDVHNTAHHGGHDAVQIWEGDVYVGGSSYMPYLAWDEVLHYNSNGGVMSGPYGFQWSPYEAGALNRIAGQRAVCGNYNAPCNIGVYLQDLPQNNHVRFVDQSGQPRINASVRVYRAEAGPGWYGKTFDNTYDAEYVTDADGYAHLPQNPFTSGGAIQHTYGLANSDIILRIAHGNQVWYRFVEAADFNMQYWQGNTQNAYYTIQLDGPTTVVHAIRGAIAGPPELNPGVTLVPDPVTGTSGPALTDGNGNYVVTVEHGWSGTIQPRMPGYSFEPEMRAYESVDTDLFGEDYMGSAAPPVEWTLHAGASLPAGGGSAVSLAVVSGGEGSTIYYLEGSGADDGQGSTTGNGFWRWSGSEFEGMTSPPLECQTDGGQTIQSDLYVCEGSAILEPDGATTDPGIWMVCHAADNHDLFGGNRDLLRYDCGTDTWSVWDNDQENTGANGIAGIGDAVYTNWQGWDPVSRFGTSGFPNDVTVLQRVTTPGNNLWPGALAAGRGTTVWGTRAVQAFPSVVELYSFDGAEEAPTCISAGAIPRWGAFVDGQPIGGIAFVPSDATSSGDDEIWILRGAGTGDLMVFDTVTASWSAVLLKDESGAVIPFQASDMAVSNQVVYFVTRGSSVLYAARRNPSAVGPNQPGSSAGASTAGLRLEIQNPLQPGGSIRYAPAAAGRVRLEVFDLSGRMIRKLVDAPASAGTHALFWDGRDDAGREAPSGILFFRLTSGGRSVLEKKVALR